MRQRLVFGLSVLALVLSTALTAIGVPLQNGALPVHREGVPLEH